MSALDVDPDLYDRMESLGEARAETGEPEPSDDAHWFTLAQEILAPIPAREETQWTS